MTDGGHVDVKLLWRSAIKPTRGERKITRHLEMVLNDGRHTHTHTHTHTNVFFYS